MAIPLQPPKGWDYKCLPPLHLVPLSNLSYLAGLQIYVTGLHEKDFNVPKEKNEVRSKKFLASEASDSFSPLPPLSSQAIQSLYHMWLSLETCVPSYGSLQART